MKSAAFQRILNLTDPMQRKTLPNKDLKHILRERQLLSHEVNIEIQLARKSS